MDDTSGRSDVEGRDIGLALRDKERRMGSARQETEAQVGFRGPGRNVASVLSMNRKVMNRSGHQHGRGEAILGIWLASCLKNAHVCIHVHTYISVTSRFTCYLYFRR